MPRDKDETFVIHCAQAWWESHRPEGWSLEQHLENPTVDLQRGPDELLARSVVELVQAKRQASADQRRRRRRS